MGNRLVTCAVIASAIFCISTEGLSSQELDPSSDSVIRQVTEGQSTADAIVRAPTPESSLSYWRDAASLADLERDPTSEDYRSILTLLEAALIVEGVDVETTFSGPLSSTDIAAMQRAISFPSPEDSLLYLLLRAPEVDDVFGLNDYYTVNRITAVPELRYVRERADTAYLGLNPNWSMRLFSNLDDPVALRSDQACANTVRLPLGTIPHVVLAAKALRAAELAGAGGRPYAWRVALGALWRAYGFHQDLSAPMQRAVIDASQSLRIADPQDVEISVARSDLEARLPDILFRARLFQAAAEAFAERADAATDLGSRSSLWVESAVSSVMYGDDPTLALNKAIVDLPHAEHTVAAQVVLWTHVLSQTGISEISLEAWRSAALGELDQDPWFEFNQASQSLDNELIWRLANARRADLAIPFLLHRLNQARDGGSASERFYLAKLAPFLFDLYSLISFEMDGTGTWTRRVTEGYPVHLDFLHNVRPGGSRCEVTWAGEVVLSDGKFLPYGALNPAEDGATTLVAHGFAVAETVREGGVVDPAVLANPMAGIERWAMDSLNRGSPSPSIVPYLKLVWIEWFLPTQGRLGEADPFAPGYRYSGLDMSNLANPVSVRALLEHSAITEHQSRLLAIFLDTHLTLSRLYPQ